MSDQYERLMRAVDALCTFEPMPSIGFGETRLIDVEAMTARQTAKRVAVELEARILEASAKLWMAQNVAVNRRYANWTYALVEMAQRVLDALIQQREEG
jgi:hypothetical protein